MLVSHDHRFNPFVVMKLIFVALLLLLGHAFGQRGPRPDCNAKLIAMDKAVEKSLLLTNPELKPFTSSEEFIDNYCK